MTNTQSFSGSFLDEPYFSRMPHLLEWRTLSHVADQYRVHYKPTVNQWEVTCIELGEIESRSTSFTFAERPTTNEIFGAFLQHLERLKCEACRDYGPQAAYYYP